MLGILEQALFLWWNFDDFFHCVRWWFVFWLAYFSHYNLPVIKKGLKILCKVFSKVLKVTEIISLKAEHTQKSCFCASHKNQKSMLTIFPQCNFDWYSGLHSQTLIYMISLGFPKMMHCGLFFNMLNYSPLLVCEFYSPNYLQGSWKGSTSKNSDVVYSEWTTKLCKMILEFISWINVRSTDLQLPAVHNHHLLFTLIP